MIKSESIDSLKDQLNIENVVSNYIQLKKRGNNYFGLCPFHDEKSPSFTVSPSRGIYKCFGCGAAGDSIKFVMEYAKLNFIEAIIQLAKDFNFTLEEEEESIEQETFRKRKYSLAQVNAAAAKHWYHKLISNDAAAKTALDYLHNRSIGDSAIVQWQIGFAPDEWHFLTPLIIESNCWEQANELGLVRNKNEQNFDVWRNRIMFPVHDVNGHIIAFGGRSMLNAQELKESSTPKYINSNNLDRFFSKGNEFYGLYFAAKGIRNHGFALLTEGYTDVIMCHEAGANNTIATLGTALTDRHATLLRRYTDSVVIARDADEAGVKATMRDIDMLLEHGFKVDVLNLNEGEDPDTWARQYLSKQSALTELH